MGLRETYGGMLEAILNKAVDKYLDADDLKVKLHEVIDSLVDEKLVEIKEYIKSDIIDLIDKEDDIQ